MYRKCVNHIYPEFEQNHKNMLLAYFNTLLFHIVQFLSNKNLISTNPIEIKKIYLTVIKSMFSNVSATMILS